MFAKLYALLANEAVIFCDAYEAFAVAKAPLAKPAVVFCAV